MWIEKFKNKNNETKYRYYEKYKDPYTDKWKRVSVVLNKDTKQSQKEAMFRLEEKIKEKLNNKSSSELKTLTFHALLDEWLEYHIKTSGSKVTTIKNFKSRMKNIKKNIPEDLLLNKVDTKYMQTFINELSNTRSQNQLSRQLGDLRESIKYAVKFYDYPNEHLLTAVKLPKKSKTIEDIQKEEAKMYNYLEMKQVLQIRDHILNNPRINKRMRVLVASLIELQALTGMRIGELQALQKSDIDLEKQIIHINGTIHWVKHEGGYGYKDTTKTKGSNRKITINKRSVSILKNIMLENKKLSLWNDGYIDREFIFTTKTGNPLYTHKINNILADTTKSLKINKKITSHTFRHTHISLLVEMNISLKAIMKRVGHIDEKTTIQVYTHVTEKMDRELTQKLENIPS
ncbi:TPA: site-specific integrase [Staphylococcus aureus]|uniref:tyrosine-type recombinase/integrase n=1 Tax=Staphylococcus aureus TaxID=1280 RepID=UPI001ADBB9D1|nr:site-specific integrase [Staphylococcus aureus]EJO9581419.1 site-specific integrase [Staphylococcus aureus]EJP1028451.1 site-specific integrase [Staphylococcus aureus]MBO8745246.1 site-specific integrase [Staphylococcus aureus]UCK13239.1 site-specific integrase [Staphylococcus aureus]UCK19716.1 site-specific integrase [Staphylococcus aureus]